MFKKNVLPLACFAMALASLALAYRAGHPLQAYLFHSDSLYLPALFADLFEHGGRLRDWYLTPAPYFFPDYPLYLGAYLIGSGPYEQILAFALLQTLLLMAAMYFLMRASVERHHVATASLITVALTWLSVNAAEPYVGLLTSAYHFGAFLSGLMFVGFWLRLERDGSDTGRRPALAGMCILAFLTSLSDNIFLVQVLLPFVATSILLRPAGKTARSFLKTPGIVLGAGVLGSLSYKLVVAHPTRYPTRLGIAQIGTNVHDLLEIFVRQFTNFPLLGLVVCAYLLFGLACTIAVARRRGWMHLPRPLLAIVTFSMLSMATTLAAVLLVKNLPVTPRYLISVLIWPVVGSVLLIQHWAGPRFSWPGSLACAAFALPLMVGSMRLAPQASPGYYPEQLACIDKALDGKSLHKGIAQYWDAKHFQMFSRNPVTLAQYVSDLTPQKWITSDRFYSPTYDFAIIDEDGGAQYKLPVETLTVLNGQPVEKVQCGKQTLLIYGPDKLRVNKVIPIGSVSAWNGCELPMRVGTATPACEAEKTDPAQEGFVTFGPYQALSAGDYAFEITYASSRAAAEAAGEWDVILALPAGAKRLQAGRLDGTAGKPAQAKGTFSVDREFDMTKIEIRTLAFKGGTMKVVSLRLERTR